MAELQELVSEADEREKHAYTPQSVELKDVWRPDLDISTAIRARVAADQQTRVPALERELEELRASNAESYDRILASEQAADAASADVATSLAMVDEVRAPSNQLLSAVTLASPEEGKALRAMVDALLTELGPV